MYVPSPDPMPHNCILQRPLEALVRLDLVSSADASVGRRHATFIAAFLASSVRALCSCPLPSLLCHFDSPHHDPWLVGNSRCNRDAEHHCGQHMQSLLKELWHPYVTEGFTSSEAKRAGGQTRTFAQGAGGRTCNGLHTVLQIFRGKRRLPTNCCCAAVS